MFDPLLIILAIIAVTLAAGLVLYYLRSHPNAQARADALAGPLIAAKVHAAEAALPSAAEIAAETAKVEQEAAALLQKAKDAESAVVAWVQARGHQVTPKG